MPGGNLGEGDCVPPVGRRTSKTVGRKVPRLPWVGVYLL